MARKEDSPLWGDPHLKKKEKKRKKKNRQTNRRTNSLTPYTGACGFFLSVKFATSQLALLAGGMYI